MSAQRESLFGELVTIPPPRRGPWKYVKFWDSIFLSDVERVEGLCRLILSERLERHFRFIVETRVEAGRLVDRGMEMNGRQAWVQ